MVGTEDGYCTEEAEANPREGGVVKPEKVRERERERDRPSGDAGSSLCCSRDKRQAAKTTRRSERSGLGHAS